MLRFVHVGVLLLCFPVFDTFRLRASRRLTAAIKALSSDEEDRMWGQSFIGQDVCGSKYNDDPFGNRKGSSDAWEVMRQRIAKLEAKDKAEAAKNRSTSVSGNTTYSSKLEPS